MGRQRNFSDAEVIEGVADVFTEHGYRGTSMQMLCDSSGLGKQSLYNSFGDKQSLYVQALDCAAARFGGVLHEMAAVASGRRAVQVFFERLLCHCLSHDAAERACIVSSGLLEGVAEPVIAQALGAKWASTHAMLRAAVQRGQDDGSIANRDDASATADLLMTLMAGLRVSARAVQEAPRLQKTIARALSVLDAAPDMPHSPMHT